MRRSCGVVTLRLPGSPATIRTTPPACSISHASSVAPRQQLVGARPAPRPARHGGTPAGSGSPTAGERSSVRATVRPSGATSLIVSVTGAAAITASAPVRSSSLERAREQRGVASGRAASWTITGSPSAAARQRRAGPSPSAPLPPATRDRVRPGRRPARPPGSATTISRDPGDRPQRVNAPVRASAGPASGTSALGRSDPRRSPRPAATISATAISLELLLRGDGDLAVAVAAAASTSSSWRCVSTSPRPSASAYISSEQRIFLARVNICFSPVDRPFSASRMARLRTTSASS